MSDKTWLALAAAAGSRDLESCERLVALLRRGAFLSPDQTIWDMTDEECGGRGMRGRCLRAAWKALPSVRIQDIDLRMLSSLSTELILENPGCGTGTLKALESLLRRAGLKFSEGSQ